MKHLTLCLGCVFALTAGSHAAITYVDASDTNTSGNGTPPSPTGGNIYNDNRWSLRTVGSTGADIVNNNVFEAGPLEPSSSVNENAPLLTTTVSGLTPGQSYQMFVYFVSQDASGTGQVWQVDAGLNPASLMFFNPNTTRGFEVGQIQQLPGGSSTYFANAVTVPSNRNYFQGNLGTAVANDSGEVQVFVDAPTGDINNNGNRRSWYDGVGFEAVPEPSTALLSLVGMTFLLRRRR